MTDKYTLAITTWMVGAAVLSFILLVGVFISMAITDMEAFLSTILIILATIIVPYVAGRVLFAIDDIISRLIK